MNSDALTKTSGDSSLASIRAEQVRRWRSGERPPVEDFLSRHPSLSGDTEAVMVLIYGEVLLREELTGTLPDVREFAERFPQLADALTAQFDLHQTLQSVCGSAAPRIPGFQILRELGRGGMGAVYLARDENLGRQVAVKVLLSGDFASEPTRQRFRTEAEAIARLQHPHIVEVHAFGEADGRPYLVLEHIAGGSLDQRLRDSSLEPRDAARLVTQLADAVEHAHQQRILHRDLKPANILLVDEAGRAGSVSDGCSRLPSLTLPARTAAKITDFGLAKRLDAGDGVTSTSQMLGTPSYMAPEQCSGAKDAGPAADIYSLGAILYECLTGRPPFKAATAMDTLAQVLHREPVAPRTLNPSVPRDLETICLKCLEKSPEKRFSSAEGLAADLRRFAAGQPVLARPIGPVARAVRWRRRHPAAAGLIAALLVGTCSTTGLAIYALNERNRAETNFSQAKLEARRADREADESFRNQYLADMTLSGQHVESRNLSLAATLIERYRHLPPGRGDPRGWEWHYLDQVSHGYLRSMSGHPPVGNRSDATTGVSFHPSGDRLLTTGGDLTARIWDVATGRPFRADAEGHCGVAGFARSGRSMLIVDASGAVWRRDAESGELELDRPIIPSAPGRVILSADGQRLAAINGEVVQFWNTDTGALVQSLAIGAKGATGGGFGPGNRTFAIAIDNAVHVWDVSANRRDRVLSGPSVPVWFATIHPDGKRIAAAGQGGLVWIWNLETGEALHQLGPLSGSVFGLAISDDGQRLAAGCEDRSVSVWDCDSGKLIATRSFPDGFAQCLAFSPDRATLAVGYMLTGQKPSVYLWDLSTQNPRSIATPDQTRPIAFGPNGDRLLVTSPKKSFVIETATCRTYPGPAGLSAALRAVQSGDVLAFADGKARRWNWQNGAMNAEFDMPKERPRGMLFSRDGQRVIIADAKHRVEMFDLEDGQRIWTVGDGRFIELRAWAPDDRLLAVTRLTPDRKLRMVEFWSAENGKSISGLVPIAMHVSQTSWSPDGSRIAFAGTNGEAAIVGVHEENLLAKWKAHTGQIDGIAWTPDSQRIITIGWDNAVRLWDAKTAQQLLTWSTTARPQGLVVSSDGRRFAVGAGGRVLLFDGRPTSNETLVDREALAIFEALGTLSPGAAADRVRHRGGTPNAVRDKVLQWLAANGS